MNIENLKNKTVIVFFSDGTVKWGSFHKEKGDVYEFRGEKFFSAVGFEGLIGNEGKSISYIIPMSETLLAIAKTHLAT